MSDVGEALRPQLWLAAIAFLVGFLSYLALGLPEPAAREGPAAVSMTSAPTPVAPVSSAPVSAEWNLPKRI